MDFSPLKPIYYRLLQLYTMGAGTLLYLWQIDSIQSKLPTAMGLGCVVGPTAIGLEWLLGNAR